MLVKQDLPVVLKGCSAPSGCGSSSFRSKRPPDNCWVSAWPSPCTQTAPGSSSRQGHDWSGSCPGESGPTNNVAKQDQYTLKHWWVDWKLPTVYLRMSTHVMELPGTELEGFQEALNVHLEQTRCPCTVFDPFQTNIPLLFSGKCSISYNNYSSLIKINCLNDQLKNRMFFNI